MKWFKKNGILTHEVDKAELNKLMSELKAELIGGASEDYDTLKEIEDYINTHGEEAMALVQTIAGKASLEDVKQLLVDYVRNDNNNLVDLDSRQIITNKTFECSPSVPIRIKRNNHPSYLGKATRIVFDDNSDNQTALIESEEGQFTLLLNNTYFYFNSNGDISRTGGIKFLDSRNWSDYIKINSMSMTEEELDEILNS